MPSHTLFLLFGATVTVLGGWWIAVRWGIPSRRALLCVLMPALLSPFGARLLWAATHLPAIVQEPARLWAWDLVDVAMLGGLLMGLPGGWMVCRALRVSSRRFVDALVLPLGTGIALARVGCFLAGCCIGRPTNLPWGVVYPKGSLAHLQQALSNPFALLSGPTAVHPTQLYEALAALLGAILVLRAAPRLGRSELPLPDGVRGLSFLAWFALFRLGNEFLRVPSPTAGTPPWFWPLVYGVLAATAVVLVGSVVSSRERRITEQPGRCERRATVS